MDVVSKKSSSFKKKKPPRKIQAKIQKILRSTTRHTYSQEMQTNEAVVVEFPKNNRRKMRVLFCSFYSFKLKNIRSKQSLRLLKLVISIA